MAFLLHIESATAMCSVALSDNDRLIAIRENNTEGYSHSRLLTTYIEAVLDEARLAASQLHAVVVSMGPGSYTGLRIGVSAAKGLCYGLELPLIAIDTLTSMTHYLRDTLSKHAGTSHPASSGIVYCPMIDARRMEVYTCLFDSQLNRITPIDAMIVEPNSFSEVLESHQVVFFGDGADKCKNTIIHPNALFMEGVTTSASGLIKPAIVKYLDRDFVNTAYFEPFYLKDFVAGKSKVKGL